MDRILITGFENSRKEISALLRMWIEIFSSGSFVTRLQLEALAGNLDELAWHFTELAKYLSEYPGSSGVPVQMRDIIMEMIGVAEYIRAKSNFSIATVHSLEQILNFFENIKTPRQF